MGKFSNFLVRELRDFVQPEEELNIPLKPQNDDPLPMNYVWIKFTKSNPIFQGKSPFQKYSIHEGHYNDENENHRQLYFCLQQLHFWHFRSLCINGLFAHYSKTTF